MGKLPEPVKAGDVIEVDGKTYIFGPTSSSLFNSFISFRKERGHWPGRGGLEREISIYEWPQGKKSRQPTVIQTKDILQAVLTAQQNR